MRVETLKDIYFGDVSLYISMREHEYATIYETIYEGNFKDVPNELLKLEVLSMGAFGDMLDIHVPEIKGNFKNEGGF